MLQVRHVFQEHKQEINLFYSFLEDIIKHDGRLFIDPPTNTIKVIKIDTTSILKSSFFLMLYNCVESTIVNCLNTIIREIRVNQCKYSDLSEAMQLVSLAAYDYNIQQAENKEKRVECLKKQIDFSTGLSVFNVDVKALTGSSSQGTFSGSLDSREIRKLFGRIGLDLTDLTCVEMVKVRDCRNKLAHGEKSFQECCRDFTIQYIEASKNNTLTYLENLIDKVDIYIQTKSYKKPVRRGCVDKCIFRFFSKIYKRFCSLFSLKNETRCI